jgi:TonB family protein
LQKGMLDQFLLLTMVLSIPVVSSAEHIALYPEKHLREVVIKSVMPEYPDEALRNGAQGTVVVAVVFDAEGQLSKAEVLEAPHPAIKKATLDALKFWRTGRYGDESGPQPMAGWLSFSFAIEKGHGRVAYAKRTDEDNQLPDKRYIHPFAPTSVRTPFYYMY